MLVHFWLSFLAAHYLISQLQHAPSHLQRQAFLEQIARFLRKFLAIIVSLLSYSPLPLVAAYVLNLALSGGEPRVTKSVMTGSCGRVQLTQIKRVLKKVAAFNVPAPKRSPALRWSAALSLSKP